MKSKYLVFFCLLALISNNTYAKKETTIELSKLIEIFMMPSEQKVEWSTGANKSTQQLAWKTSGIDEKPKCGSFEACRRGSVRIAIHGREIQHLRKHLEPITWELFMASKLPAKFGPQILMITPSCDTVECSFDFLNAIKNNEITFSKLCSAGPLQARDTIYNIQKNGRSVLVVVSENEGSGGSSTSLTLLFDKPEDQSNACATIANN